MWYNRDKHKKGSDDNGQGEVLHIYKSVNGNAS